MKLLLKITLTAYYKYVTLVKAATENILELLNVPESEIYMIKLAISEATVNVIEHAYKGETGEKIEFFIYDIGENKLKFILRDYGKQKKLEEIKGRELEDFKENGLGVHLIKIIMDKIEYKHLEVGTELNMEKNLKINTL